MKAYIFPGQGSQYTGMGKDLYNNYAQAKELFDRADNILGFKISEVMFEGTDSDLKQTKITQPAIFIHSVALAIAKKLEFTPDMVAGHSLGEFSALVASGAMGFKDGLELVSNRANAMQLACELEPSTMAAILGSDAKTIENVCSQTEGVVVPANYNSPAQIVISGDLKAIENACEKLKEKGAKRTVILPVGGAFHSPLMEPAREKLEKAIRKVKINKPICPIFQNVDAKDNDEPLKIKENLIAQLTAPVLWTQTIENMITKGATEFIEVGPGKVLQGLVKKINRKTKVSSL